MQKVQRWSQPFCTWTKARVRPSSALDQVTGGLRHRHDVVDLHLVVERHAERHRPIALGLELVGIADDEIDLGHVGEGARLGLRRAAGDDDLPRRVVALGLADRLLGLPHRLGGHGAGVDDQRIGQARPSSAAVFITSDS